MHILAQLFLKATFIVSQINAYLSSRRSYLTNDEINAFIFTKTQKSLLEAQCELIHKQSISAPPLKSNYQFEKQWSHG